MDNFVMDQATELQLDRSDWQLVKFGDLAIQQKESIDRDNTELTRYVKGEHMGSEDLHIREWGELTDEYLGPAFNRVLKFAYMPSASKPFFGLDEPLEARSGLKNRF
ncbi:hypothetical protein [Methylomonas sp. HYX-M1]|uniref:hypothetical protein n=1 Tax=Methylomonas sp. HYX-M1 TaxID=3139307 RepID=UPI00345C1F34